MNWIKIFLINILVLVAIFGTVEIGLRVAWTIKRCVSSIGCDYSRITSIRIYDPQTDFVEENLGLSSYDMSLGYVPTAGWDGNITSSGWKTDSKVTIQPDGFRSNDNKLSSTKYSVLAVGDSFTFGDQVSNLDTWPSCVEKLLELPVANAGVFGYGAAHSVLRASIEAKKRDFETVILSILVNHDFQRDQLTFLSGFPRPPVIQTAEGLAWGVVPSERSIGSRFNKSPPKNLYASLVQNSLFVYFSHSRIIQKYIDITGRQRSEKATNAAALTDIVKFTIEKLDEVSIKRKVVVLQYTEGDLTSTINDQNLTELRDSIQNLLNKHDMILIDTFDKLSEKLKTQEINTLWNGHHTKEGNQLVCNLIVDELQK